MAPSCDFEAISRQDSHTLFAPASPLKEAKSRDIYKIVKARQNLIFIEKENAKLKSGNADQQILGGPD